MISTWTSSPGPAMPSKLTVLLWRVRPRRRVGSLRLGPLDQDLHAAADEALGPLPRPALHELDEALHALALDGVGELALHLGRLGAAARREDEGEGAVVADLLHDLQRSLEVLLALAREADDDVRGDRAVRHVLADQRDPVHVALAVVGAAHPLQHRARPRLQRQVDVLAERGQARVGGDHVLAHVLRVRARVADALDARHGVDPLEQLREADPALERQVAAVAVDVLAEQRHLDHPVAGQPLHFGDQLGRVAADLAASRRGHDAVRADAVAALRDLHPALELPRPLHRQVARDLLELEVALRAERVGVEELGQPVDLPGAEGHVHEGEAAEDLVLHRLRPAAADPDHPRRVLALQALRLPEVGDEAVVRRLADRAGVEEDQVGIGALRCLDVAERVEHSLHPLGVVLVHLAPERRHVVALGLHPGSG